MSLTKISRSTLTEQVVQSLMEYIYAQDLKPGDILPSETSLAGQLGVSRPVIREAIKIMVGQHIITVENGRGAVIQPVDDSVLDFYFQHAIRIETNSVLELAEIREALEVKSAALAAHNRSESDLKIMDATLAKMRNSLTDRQVYAVHDAEFHIQIARSSSNTMLRNLLSTIRDAIEQSINLALAQRKTLVDLQNAHDFHEQILKSIHEQNGDAAARAMREHFQDAMFILKPGPGKEG